MEREFLDVLDYELSVSEADLLDLHETFVLPDSPQQAPQLHPFFHSSALEHDAQSDGIEMSRTRRVSDETSDEEEQDHDSVTFGSFYEGEAPNSPRAHHTNSETQVAASSSTPSSSSTPTASDSSSEPSAPATSAFSFQSQKGSKPFTAQDRAQKTTISRALWLAGHHLISSLPTALPQLAVSS